MSNLKIIEEKNPLKQPIGWIYLATNIENDKIYIGKVKFPRSIKERWKEHLKEGRKLILVIRETPLDLPSIKNMLTAKQSGAVILPAMPGFYHKPKTIEDLVDFVVGKIFDQFNIEHSLFKRWD